MAIKKRFSEYFGFLDREVDELYKIYCGGPEEAIRQIQDKGYALRLKGKQGEKRMYTGRILAVGISYDRKTKKHRCKEVIVQD